MTDRVHMGDTHMDQNMKSRATALNAYQIAGLALATSTIVAIAVLVVLRRTVLSHTAPEEVASTGTTVAPTPVAEREDASTVQPAVDTEMPAAPPSHFSEDLVIPGFTETGAQIEEDDDAQRPSPGNV